MNVSGYYAPVPGTLQKPPVEESDVRKPFIKLLDRALRRQNLALVAPGDQRYWAWQKDDLRITVHFEGDLACWIIHYIMRDGGPFDDGFFLVRATLGQKDPATRETVARIVNAYRRLAGDITEMECSA